ncbi:hypothetical protein D1007_04073 [Hordeum vulgare]|nr:hypothetical protein D1007_04073 [Hordeum vulgare]
MDKHGDEPPGDAPPPQVFEHGHVCTPSASQIGKENNDTCTQHAGSNTNSGTMFQAPSNAEDANAEVQNEEEHPEINIDLTQTEVSDGLLCDDLINMLRKSVERKQNRKIIRKETKKRNRISKEHVHKGRGDAVAKAYSRCSVSYFVEVVKSTTKSAKKVELVRGIGFGFMLELDDCIVPRPFAQWIADNVSVKDEQILLNNKGITLSAESVFHVLGIPAGENTISMANDGGKADFLAFFGLSEVPTIKYFGNKTIADEEMSDEGFIRCFMVVLLATFLCPTSNTKPSTKYMAALNDVSKIKGFNWCKFTHEWLMHAISKYQKEKLKQDRITITLGGCIFHLAVRCLDFIDFGSIELQSTMPRLFVWKGNLIKLFSDMLVDLNGAYGAFKVKIESETCYGEHIYEWASTDKNSYMRDAIQRTVGDSFSVEVKEDIYKTFQHFMKDEGRSTCSKVKELILQTLKIVLCARAASEKTVKIDSSNNDYVSTNGNLDSDATVKVNSHGEPEDGETNIMARKKRKLSDEEERSTKKEKKLSQQSTGSVGTHSKAQQHLVGDDRNACTQTSIPEFVQSKSFEFEETNKAIQKQKKSMNSIGATAASFDYMLCSKENPSTSFKQQAQGVTTRTHSFFGFTNNTSSQKEKQISDKLLENKMNLDMNKVFLPDDEIEHTQSCWAKYLDEARKKYFFYSDDIPTFRLFENNDDCGKEITEPKLWRPLDMDSDAYERKIQVKKNLTMFFSMLFFQLFIEFQDDFSSMEKDIPACCGQYQQSESYNSIAPRPLTVIKPDGTIVHLTSPKADSLFQWNHDQTCYSPRNRNNIFSIQRLSYSYDSRQKVIA